MRTRKKLNELLQFPLPKSCRQPRSGGTKPRTEFTDSAWSSSGSSLEILIYKDGMTTTTTTTASPGQEIYCPALGDKKQKQKFDPVHCTVEDGGSTVPFTNLLNTHLTEVESVSQKKLFGATSNWIEEQNSDGNFDADSSSKPFDSTLDKVNHGVNNNEDIQALGGNASGDSFLDWGKTTDMLRTPLQLHESRAGPSGSASCSSRSEDSRDERGRGKRKRKPKLHFDETTPSATSVKQLRRLRIMRYLGLVAPPGSPFSAAAHVKTACRSRRILRI